MFLKYSGSKEGGSFKSRLFGKITCILLVYREDILPKLGPGWRVKMKVLFIVDSLNYGGAGRVVSLIASELCKGKNTIEILLLGQICHESNLREYPVNENVIVTYYEKETNRKVSHWYNYVNYIRSYFRNEKIDVCFAFLNVYAEYALIAKLFTKTKVIACERNDPHNSPLEKVYRIARNPLYATANKIVCQTKDMVSFFPMYIQKKCTIISNPINKNISAVYGGKRQDKIVMVGKLTAQKNYTMAVDAFSKIMDKLDTYVVEIYGEGQLRNHIQEQIENMGLENRIFLKGHSDNVFNEIEDAKLFVMSSDYEGMPNALMEAMAMGLPCIATDCPIGGSREIIRDGENGILVPVNDSDYLANEILKVLGDNDLQCRLSLEASKIRNTLDISVIAKKWEELL